MCDAGKGRVLPKFFATGSRIDRKVTKVNTVRICTLVQFSNSSKSVNEHGNMSSQTNVAIKLLDTLVARVCKKYFVVRSCHYPAKEILQSHYFQKFAKKNRNNLQVTSFLVN